MRRQTAADIVSANDRDSDDGKKTLTLTKTVAYWRRYPLKCRLPFDSDDERKP